jgi:GAF domain-containing protein
MYKEVIDWQKLFTRMMEDALRKTSFHEVSVIVVNYALQLGFSRAHLFWVPTQEDANPDNKMIGIACAGDNCIPSFSRQTRESKLYTLKDWFELNRAIQSRDVFFLSREEVERLKKQAKTMGYQWPKGEIAFLPLWGSNRLLGELMLDHGQSENALSKQELSLLNFFARQVAVLLENASLIAREQRSVQEMTTINQVGRLVTDRAAEETDLSPLLDEVYKRVGLLMEVTNFTVVLVDPESGEPNLKLLYKNGIRQNHLQTSPMNLEIENYLLNRDGGIFWTQNVSNQLQKNNIKLEDEIPTSCIGVQLQVGKNVIGGIVVKVCDGNYKFTRRDYFLLDSIASQFAGAIQLFQANVTEKRDAARLNVLRRTMMEMLHIAQENEENLWLTALTFATSKFGTGFNRALLFLENEDRSALIGKAGIDTNDFKQARKNWKNNVNRNYDFGNFLEELKQNRIRITDFHSLVKNLEIQLVNTKSTVHQVLKTKQRQVVENDKIEKLLPREFSSDIPLAECAVLPILSGNRTIGVVILDNKHNGKPLSEKMLNQLQTLLNYTGLVWETLRQQKKIESLLDANNQIMGEARLQSLKDTLRNICRTAQEFTEADWVLIYPLKEEGDTLEFDTANATFIGNLKLMDDVIKEKPSQNGTCSHIIKNGKLIIHDIEKTDIVIENVHISEHEFIKRERVKAVIGIAIHDTQKDEPLGILYLDYRTPQHFSDLDIHHARSFASLAAIAISNARRFDELRHRKRLEAAQEIAEAIGTELDRTQMYKKVLQRLQGFFEHTSLCIMTYDEDENALKFAPSTLEFYKIHNPQFQEQHTFPLSGKSLACQVARDALKTKNTGALNIANVEAAEEYLDLNPKTRSEVCVPLIDSQQKLLGVLVLERTKLYGFDDDDIALVETVARQLSMAMERTQRSEQLSFKTTVAALTSWAADIAHDINNEAGEIKGYAYLVKELAQEDEQIISYMNKIEESAQRLFDAGPKSVQGKQALPLNQAIKKYAEQIAQHRDIQVEFLLDEQEYHIFVNPTDFRRVLQHLTRNADKAMSSMEKKKISIITRGGENSEVEILFRDHGPGVPDEVRLSVFQKSVTTKQTGGFGLLLTRQFVEDMGGTIRLLPAEPDVGATFSIKLPITQFDDVNIE